MVFPASTKHSLLTNDHNWYSWLTMIKTGQVSFLNAQEGHSGMHGFRFYSTSYYYYNVMNLDYGNLLAEHAQ